MKIEKFVETFLKADELTKQAIEALVKDPRKYEDLFDLLKGGDIDAKELTKLILERT